MVALGLLFAGRHLVDGEPIQRQALAFRLGQALAQAGVRGRRAAGPVQHVAGVVQAEEGNQLQGRSAAADQPRRAEGQRLPFHGADPLRDVHAGRCHKHRRLLLGADRAVGDVAHARAVGDEAQAFAGEGVRLGRQHDGAVQHGHLIGPAGQGLERGAHRQEDVDAVAGAPVAARDCQVAVARHRGPQALAVQAQLHATRPARLAHAQAEAAALFDDEPAAGGVGEASLLLQLHAALGPVQRGGDEQVQVQRFPLVGVDEGAMPRMALQPRADAAPHRLLRGRIDAVMLRPHRREVDEAAVLRVLRGQQVVEQRALDVVGVARLRVLAEQGLAQAHHVHAVAGLGALDLVEHRLEVGGVVEMLLHAVAADGHRAPFDHGLPEALRGRQPARLGAQLGQTREADHLGNLRVRVQAGERVFALEQRLQQGLVREAARQAQVARFVVAERGQVGEQLVHAAVLALQAGLHLRVAQAGGDALGPVGKRAQHGQGVRVGGVHMGVAQAGGDLVQVVPRHPTAVEREAVDLDLSGGELGPGLLALRNAAQVARADLPLGLLEPGHHEVQALTDQRVVAGRRHHGQGGQVVAGHVAVQSAGLPVAVGRLGGRQAGLAAVGRQQALRIQRQQGVAVALLRGQQRTVLQAHGRQREGLRAGRRRSRADPQPRQQQCGGGWPHQSPVRTPQSETPSADTALKQTTKALALACHWRESRPL